MRIRWTPAAAADLEQINGYLTERLPNFRRSTMLRIYESVQSLRRMPNKGRLGREAGTRELVLVPLPYIVAYRVKKDEIAILHIHHGARERS
jgi:addiction module RelE/StbE family toxin